MQSALHDANRLCLLLVVLQTETMAGFDVEYLAAILVRLSPNFLVTPRLLDDSHCCVPLVALTRSDDD